MSKFVFTDIYIALNELNISGFADSVEMAASADELDVTTFGAGGYREKVTGLGMFSTTIGGFQDYVAPSPGATLGGPANLGGLDTFSMSIPGTALGDVAYMGTSRSTSLKELTGNIGEPARFEIVSAGASRVVKGSLIHVPSAETSTGSETAVAFTPPTATQGLYASFHVHSVTGTGSIQFTVATDDNSGFSSGVTRITSDSFTDVGHQFASLAGALAGETHIRTAWTISGFTSVTFGVAAGVG